MNDEQVFELAEKNSFQDDSGCWIFKDEGLLDFVFMVQKAEREACAKLCDDKVDAEYATGKVDHNEMGWTQACALAIRARGEK